MEFKQLNLINDVVTDNGKPATQTFIPPPPDGGGGGGGAPEL